MLQRIQTVYLFVSLAMVSIIMFFPLAEFKTITGETIEMFHDSMRFQGQDVRLMGTYPITIMSAIVMLLTIITIFSYKKRKGQIRLCIYNIILMFGLYGLIYFFYRVGIKEVMEEASLELVSRKMEPVSILPVLSTLFTYLASKKIMRDEILVKSIDRLR